MGPRVRTGGVPVVKLVLLKGHSRIWVPGILNNVKKMEVMVDTGCHTTMICNELAEKHGESLPDATAIGIGGDTVNVQAYRLKSLSFGGLEIRDVFVWGMPCTPRDELYRKALLGLNVMNNWDYGISRNKNIMRIDEDVFSNMPESDYPYMHKFADGKYVQWQDKVVTGVKSHEAPESGV